MRLSGKNRQLIRDFAEAIGFDKVVFKNGKDERGNGHCDFKLRQMSLWLENIDDDTELMYVVFHEAAHLVAWDKWGMKWNVPQNLRNLCLDEDFVENAAMIALSSMLENNLCILATKEANEIAEELVSKFWEVRGETEKNSQLFSKKKELPEETENMRYNGGTRGTRGP